MDKLSKAIVKYRHLILVLSVILLIPAAIGYFNTRVNYDLLYYLPSDIDTMKGQEIMLKDFKTGAFGIAMVDGMKDKEVSELIGEMKKVKHVHNVLWYDSFDALGMPKEMLPGDIYNKFNKDSSTIMMIIFDDSSSGEGTMQAIEDIRKITKHKAMISGISAIVTDTKNLSEKETPIYVAIAVLLSIIILGILMESWLIPVLMLVSIGFAIVYNLGTNIVFGEISYITKALAAVLQLGVTMDYSIFLWHSYLEQRGDSDDKVGAMENAIKMTISSVLGSSITTIAGFIALCFMSFTLGLDMGIVMAKGVIFGVIGCVTILPAFILIFDKPLLKLRHKSLLPEFNKIPAFITKHYKPIIALFIVILIPSIYGEKNAAVYYDLSLSLPQNLESVATQTKLNNEYKFGSASLIILDSKTKENDKTRMLKDLEKVDGVEAVIGVESLTSGAVPMAFIPKDMLSAVKNDKYQLAIFMSKYKTGSDEANAQSDKAEKIIHSYDKKAMLVGEAACTRDLIKITDKDFKVVSFVSIFLILIIIGFVFKSISLPVILVAVIEFAIFLNMGIPYYTKTVLPFVASIVIGTIQLGATVDYAILMTNRYKYERRLGHEKHEASFNALKVSMKSVIVSALTFFGATIGVGLYSSIDMISSLCILMARGAIISMISVLFILPAMYIAFDGLIVKGSKDFLKK